MSHYRCTEEGRREVRWGLYCLRAARQSGRAADDFVLRLFRAVLRAKMVFDVVAPGEIVTFTTGCELTAGRYSQLTPGSRVVTRPNVEQVMP